ncbi:TPA: 50S ribosomal protein L18e [Candidatus Bathyarchaeota archaeon]|nr:50S ribosomal protein L18e [Candidatus Bathyarchaeota archaeon]
MRRARATNPELLRCIRALRKRGRSEGAPIWMALAEHLSKPKHRRAAVNVGRIDRHTREGDTVVVPGKVLGAGLLGHAVNVAAFAFSESARLKIEKAGGRCLTIEELMELAPRGTNVRVMR